MNGDQPTELKPNVWSGAVQLIFDNYLMDRHFTKKNMPHEFLIYGIMGVGLVGYFASVVYTPYNLPFYTVFALPVMGFALQVYFLYGELSNRHYLIRKDSVEIQDDFFDKESSSARFENITDLKLEKPFIQRLFGTGNIRMSTAGEGVESELVVRYLDNVDEYYDELSNLVNSSDYNQELY